MYEIFAKIQSGFRFIPLELENERNWYGRGSLNRCGATPGKAVGGAPGGSRTVDSGLPVSVQVRDKIAKSDVFLKGSTKVVTCYSAPSVSAPRGAVPISLWPVPSGLADGPPT